MDTLHHHDKLTGQIYLHPRGVLRAITEAGGGADFARWIGEGLLRDAYDQQDQEEVAA